MKRHGTTISQHPVTIPTIQSGTVQKIMIYTSILNPLNQSNWGLLIYKPGEFAWRVGRQPCNAVAEDQRLVWKLMIVIREKALLSPSLKQSSSLSL